MEGISNNYYQDHEQSGSHNIGEREKAHLVSTEAIRVNFTTSREYSIS